MRNPRRIQLTPEMAANEDLPTTSPPEDSLFWQMWRACEAVAQAALATDFVQGIKAGTLPPQQYGAFFVSDAYYCYHGADDYGAAVSRATDPVLKAFLQAKHDSYAEYNATLPGTWRVRDGSAIVPTDVCRAYSAFESKVASEDAPIYTLIAMLPCEYLWPWLAQQLAGDTEGNLYASWITENNSAHGAFKMGNFLVDWMQANPGGLDADTATSIYRQAITYEMQNFATATPKKASG